MSIPPDTDPAPVPVSQALETTGVPQLDLVLGGGLPRGTLLMLFLYVEAVKKSIFQ